jgi:hypothetical protein
VTSTFKTDLERLAAGHTPTPWSLRDKCIVFVPYTGTIAETFGQAHDTCDRNAAFIVLACNSYDAMQAALGRCVTALSFELENARSRGDDIAILQIESAKGAAIAALRLARGEQVCGADPVKSGQQSVEQGGADGRMLPVSGAPSNSDLRDENEQLRQDAERWRALVGSARLEWMGCAGFDFDDENKPIKDCNVTARAGDPLHFAMSFWSDFPAKDIPSGHAFAVRFLTAYADECRRRAALTQEAQP